MTIVLHLSPEMEAKLLEHAAAAGKRPEDLALNALEEQLAVEPPVAESRTPQQWVADFRRWAESHRRLPVEADDSRESIYAGRGE
jgi:hypothetical protein